MFLISLAEFWPRVRIDDPFRTVSSGECDPLLCRAARAILPSVDGHASRVRSEDDIAQSDQGVVERRWLNRKDIDAGGGNAARL